MPRFLKTIALPSQVEVFARHEEELRMKICDLLEDMRREEAKVA